MRDIELKKFLKEKSGTYTISNIITGSTYSGSSKNLSKRYWNHLLKLEKGTHPNKKLQANINKYGIRNFIFEVEKFCPEILMKKNEQVLIDIFDTYRHGMNLSPSATNTLGVKMSDKAKRNISIGRTGKMKGEDHPNFGKGGLPGILNGMYGKKHSEETRSKISKATKGINLEQKIGKERADKFKEETSKRFKGCIVSKKTIEKRQKTCIEKYGRKSKPATKEQRKIAAATRKKNFTSSKNFKGYIYQYSLDKTILIKIWESIGEIVKFFKRDGTGISRCTNGSQTHSWGFYWTRIPL